MKNNQRKRIVDDIIQLCVKKQWCNAEELCKKYLDECRDLWKQYDTIFNYKFNRCGFCRNMKQAIVKPKWSEAEQYPLYSRLTCVNQQCTFYLVFNSDIYVD